MQLADLVVEKLVGSHDRDFLGVEGILNLELSGLSPLLDRLALKAEVKSNEDAVPVVFGCEVLLLEDEPRVQHSRLQPLVAQTVVHGASFFLSSSSSLMLQTLAVELHCPLEESESQSTHEGVASILLIGQIIDSVTPTTD